jgi:hypothetical protein
VTWSQASAFKCNLYRCYAEVWNDKKLSLLQMYKAHVGKLGVDAAKELNAPDAAEMTRAHRLKLMVGL